MLIISKKRIFLMITIVFVSIATFSIKVNQENTIVTSSLPVTNKVIILDARASENQMRELLVILGLLKRALIYQ